MPGRSLRRSKRTDDDGRMDCSGTQRRSSTKKLRQQKRRGERSAFESRSMGRWQVSVSSEMFHRQTKKQRSAVSVVTEIGAEHHHHHRAQDEKKRSKLTTSIITTRDTERTMCNDSGGGVVGVVVAAPAEEWSPIREAPPSLPRALYDPFPVEEQDASSDMDTEEDTVPLVRRPHEAAGAVGLTASAADAGADVKAGAADNVGSFAAGAGSDAHALDRSGGVSYVTTTGGEPASKRKRLPDLGINAVVEVTYDGLSRESKNVLRQALQTWSHWHSRRYPSGMEGREEVLQNGTEVYSPALALDPSSTNGTISVWMDKPLKRRKTKIEDKREVFTAESRQDVLTAESHDKEKDVPLYDRACTSALSSHDVANSDEYTFIEPEEASRCFNCGSYSHALRNCTRPQSVAAIRSARDTLANKRGPRPRTPSRYYQCSPGGKFDDLKPGVLTPEARIAVGIGELDPPPWLNRMREIGYPPGYLEDTEDESSGVQVIDDDTEGVTGRGSIEEGNDVENVTPADELKTGQKMTVDYPGINAPVPEDADKELWAVRSETHPVEPRGWKRPYHQISQMHNSGSGLLSPITLAKSWAVGIGDVDLRVESYARSISTGRSERYSAGSYEGMESHLDLPGSNIYGLTSPAVDIKGNPSVDPSNHWSTRRISGTGTLSGVLSNTRYGTQAYHHIPSSPSGLASPLRGLLGIPGPMEAMSSPSHIYSRHNYYHSGPQGSPLTTGQSPNPTTNQAWLKAQSALDALRPSDTTGGLLTTPAGALLASPTGGLLATPYGATGGALQNSRSPGMSHQWGRRE